MAENVIFNEPAMEFTDMGVGLFLWQAYPAVVNLTAGESYRVEWNGTEYNCVAFNADFNGIAGIGVGNLALAGMESNTTEPFLLGTAIDGSFSACYTTETNAANSMAIYHVVEEDKEYLIWGSTLKAIGNAIREKTGKTDAISPSDMPGEIRGITGGGSGADVVYVTFMNHDGTKELHKRAVVPGNTCLDPVVGGLIDTPTKESTNTEVFDFSGWSLTSGGSANSYALKNVTEDRTVYVAFETNTRYYTVRFYDGETLLDSVKVEYGETAEYPSTIEKDGYQFDGWSPSNTNITADTDCYAQWSEAITFANASWGQINEISESGQSADYFAVGDEKVFANADGTKNYKLRIIGTNFDDKADGSGKAGLTVALMTETGGNVGYGYYAEYESGTWQSANTGSMGCTMRNTMQTTIYGYLPAELQSIIKPVTKYTNYSSTSGAYCTATTDTLFAPSFVECGLTGGPTPSESQEHGAYPGLSTAAQRKTGSEWWTRTNGYQVGYFVSTDGNKPQTPYLKMNSNKYYMPCFCI